MKYQAVIFDLDGVLCHTDYYHYLAWKELADELEIFFDQRMNERLRGVSRMASLEIILQRAGNVVFTEGEKAELAARKNDRYRSMLKGLTGEDVSEDVWAVLEWMKKRSIRMAIGSSSKNAELILERLKIIGYFEAISDGAGITRSKPDPEVFLKAAEMLKLSPCNCLIVEDADAGIEAALAGGFDCAGLGPAAVNPRTVYPLNHIKELCSVML